MTARLAASGYRVAAIARTAAALEAVVDETGAAPHAVDVTDAAAVCADIWDEANVWSPPELAADLIEFLESGALDALSGRYIHARNDDWRGMADRIPEILERDLHALRVVQD